MFDQDLVKIMAIILVAVVVIGPKDLPRALRAAGRWAGKARRVSNHFRAGVENMIREAELEEMEKKWREQNEAIMRANPAVGVGPAQPLAPPAPEGVPHAESVTPAPETPAPETQAPHTPAKSPVEPAQAAAASPPAP